MLSPDLAAYAYVIINIFPQPVMSEVEQALLITEIITLNSQGLGIAEVTRDHRVACTLENIRTVCDSNRRIYQDQEQHKD